MNTSIITILGATALGLSRRHTGSSIRLKLNNLFLIDHNVIFEVSEWNRNIDLDKVSDSINKKLLELSYKEMNDFFIWQQIEFDWYDRYHATEWIDVGREEDSPIVYKGAYIKTFISNKDGSLKNPIESFTPVGADKFYPKENGFLDSIYGDYIDMIMEALYSSIVQWHRTGDGFYTNMQYGVLVKEDNSPYFRKGSTMPQLRKK